MDSSLIRKKFLDFFESKGHKIVPSAPLVLKNDPSLLFTNSGMVQFKDYFLGNATPTYRRVVDTQKCLRVSGKHNDLEDVGLDTYHHTMFEMLGNWGFGDYFKKEAIVWAWELLTEVYKLPKDRLYVTIFGGDVTDNLPVDEEAKTLWKTVLDENRILHGSKKDNFWEMGESGPCGPCSEIHVDLRPDSEIEKQPGRELVNKDHPQVVEIWNLVFIQYNRLSSGTLEPLPDKHVDTGMGFERLCMAIQGTASNYDTDIFRPLIDFVALRIPDYKYGSNSKKDIAVRVLVDHIRAVSFSISDGQLPSNTGAGYVIRRILRRAVRYGFSHLDFKEPFMYRLVPLLALQFKDVFPELHQQQEYVSKVVQEEEISFLRTLEKGLKRIELFDKMITGEQAFELYDTFGFPFDLTSLIARERHYTIDEKGFIEEMAKQKERSKEAAIKKISDWTTVSEGDNPEFIGYDATTSVSKILRYRKVKQKNQELYQIVLDKTPFYAESGGQSGDTGVLKIGEEEVIVIDTKKENDLIVHWVEKLPKLLEGEVQAKIDEDERRLSTCNHSATHLLHAALRQILGQHVEQKGSYINTKILRFDFSHFAAMTSEEMIKVENIVNDKIRKNIALNEQRNVPIEHAKKLGAMALFGEKYGDFVRVISFDPQFSIELCGGTHVKATGNIGLFKIISESSVAAGVRRIEAVTADGAQEYLNHSLMLLNEVKSILKNPKDVVASVQLLTEEKYTLEKKLEGIYLQQAKQIKNILVSKAVKVNNCTFINEKVQLSHIDALKNIAYALRNQFDDLLLVLAADVENKPHVVVMIGEQLALTQKFHAGNMVKELAKEIEGGGGGQSFFATAGGKNLEGLDAVLKKSQKLVC